MLVDARAKIAKIDVMEIFMMDGIRYRNERDLFIDRVISILNGSIGVFSIYIIVRGEKSIII